MFHNNSLNLEAKILQSNVVWSEMGKEIEKQTNQNPDIQHNFTYFRVF